MTEKHITPTDPIDPLLRRLYESAFPEEEQIPWDDLLVLTEKMPLDFTAYYDDSNRLLGLTIVYPRQSLNPMKANWFWYFAVPEELRGRGIGQSILKRLMEKYDGCTNILDMESPEQVCDNSLQRQRRHQFYLRNGFHDTGVGRSFGGIDYTIMMKGEGTFTMKDYDEIIAELRSFWERMPNGKEHS
ncbi:MAG: GNAT family N-acetyltransferase [Bacteroidaceae bacterium]|nr:GNAT family N-acetyltransferase [Bacteroidaceae bacterium]